MLLLQQRTVIDSGSLGVKSRQFGIEEGSEVSCERGANASNNFQPAIGCSDMIRSMTLIRCDELA